jgi:hypothetical protein
MTMPRLPLTLALAALTAGCAKPDRPAATPTPAPPAKASEPPAPPPAAPAPPERTGESVSASREAEEACVDKWLAERKLDPYGNPEGTMYAGGTPLFNERTGETVDRLDYVYRRQPLARAACREK